jgi:hypothetical protein
MAAGDLLLGLEGAFNYGTAGAPAATLTNNVDGVSLSLSHRMAEAIRRGQGYVTSKPTIKEATLTFKVIDVEGDAFLAACEAAFFNKTKIAIWAKDKTAGKGLDADWYISQFTRDEPNEDFIGYSVEAKPTDETRDPSWH